MKSETLHTHETANDGNALLADGKICGDCGDKLQRYEEPKEGTLFRIPFTQIDIMWRKWNCYAWYCMSCSCDKANEPFRRAYQAGKEDGYMKGCEDAERGW